MPRACRARPRAFGRGGARCGVACSALGGPAASLVTSAATGADSEHQVARAGRATARARARGCRASAVAARLSAVLSARARGCGESAVAARLSAVLSARNTAAAAAMICRRGAVTGVQLRTPLGSSSFSMRRPSSQCCHRRRCWRTSRARSCRPWRRGSWPWSGWSGRTARRRCSPPYPSR